MSEKAPKKTFKDFKATLVKMVNESSKFKSQKSKNFAIKYINEKITVNSVRKYLKEHKQLPKMIQENLKRA